MDSHKCSKGKDHKLPCRAITALSLAVDRAEGQKESVYGRWWKLTSAEDNANKKRRKEWKKKIAPLSHHRFPKCLKYPQLSSSQEPIVHTVHHLAWTCARSESRDGPVQHQGPLYCFPLWSLLAFITCPSTSYVLTKNKLRTDQTYRVWNEHDMYKHPQTQRKLITWKLKGTQSALRPRWPDKSKLPVEYLSKFASNLAVFC